MSYKAKNLYPKPLDGKQNNKTRKAKGTQKACMNVLEHKIKKFYKLCKERERDLKLKQKRQKKRSVV